MNFNYVKHKNQFFIFSIVITLIGILSLVLVQLNLGIDFKSGTRVEVQSSHTLHEKELQTLFKQIHLSPKEITFSGEREEIGILRFEKTLTKKEVAKVKVIVENQYQTEPNVSTVSPTVGKELAKNALLALSLASVGIVLYLAVRFDWLKGAATIVAMLHDVFVMITVFSICHIEVDVTFIAAILTIAGYSINDSIVTFDRIRENTKAHESVTSFEQLATIVNDSLNQTLRRSINTVMTVLIAAVALYLFGGDSIKNFSLALVIGLITGAYSSIFISSQLWLVWEWKKIKKEQVKKA